MLKFSPGDLIISINSGEEFWVMEYFRSYKATSFGVEKYTILGVRDGAVHEVIGNAISNYRLGKFGSTMSIKVAPVVPNCTINLDDIEMENVEFDDTHLKLQKYSRGCDHDWITWTGLHGTQTDCSKCKEVKKEV